MEKRRLGINDQKQVIAIYYDSWNGKEFEVPNDFELNFNKGIPYKVEKGKILIDSLEQEKRIILEEISKKEEYLSKTKDSIIEAQEHLILGRDIPSELLIRVEKRQEIRKEIDKLKKEL